MLSNGTECSQLSAFPSVPVPSYQKSLWKPSLNTPRQFLCHHTREVFQRRTHVLKLLVIDCMCLACADTAKFIHRYPQITLQIKNVCGQYFVHGRCLKMAVFLLPTIFMTLLWAVGEFYKLPFPSIRYHRR